MNLLAQRSLSRDPSPMPATRAAVPERQLVIAPVQPAPGQIVLNLTSGPISQTMPLPSPSPTPQLRAVAPSPQVPGQFGTQPQNSLWSGVSPFPQLPQVQSPELFQQQPAGRNCRLSTIDSVASPTNGQRPALLSMLSVDDFLSSDEGLQAPARCRASIGRSLSPSVGAPRASIGRSLSPSIGAPRRESRQNAYVRHPSTNLAGGSPAVPCMVAGHSTAPVPVPALQATPRQTIRSGRFSVQADLTPLAPAQAVLGGECPAVEVDPLSPRGAPCAAVPATPPTTTWPSWTPGPSPAYASESAPEAEGGGLGSALQNELRRRGRAPGAAAPATATPGALLGMMSTTEVIGLRKRAAQVTSGMPVRPNTPLGAPLSARGPRWAGGNPSPLWEQAAQMAMRHPQDAHSAAAAVTA